MCSYFSGSKIKPKPEKCLNPLVLFNMKNELLVLNEKKTTWPWEFNIIGLNSLQSPIDFNISKLQKANFAPLEITVPKDLGETCIFNTGRGVKVTEAEPSEKICISGSFLHDLYVFDHMLYHWGDLDHCGSEHFIDGEAYSGEVQIVTYKREYGDLKSALERKNGVVVLAFFFQVGSLNPRLESLLRYLPGVMYKGTRIVAPESDPMLWFMPDLMYRNKSHYYTCPGSLTSPPYPENVTFIVLPTPLCISPSQLKKFRSLKDSKGRDLLSNRREIQPLMSRPIYIGREITWNCRKEYRSYVTKRLKEM